MKVRSSTEQRLFWRLARTNREDSNGMHRVSMVDVCQIDRMCRATQVLRDCERSRNDLGCGRHRGWIILITSAMRETQPPLLCATQVNSPGNPHPKFVAGHSNNLKDKVYL